MISATAILQVAHANSLTVDGPGFKVEKKHGWFGHNSTSYQDALGNKVEKSTGIFGRTTTHTKLFGSEAIKRGNNVEVLDTNGKPLVTTRRTLFHGKETHVDGNGIFQSVKDLFKQ
jgi:hypothetical protein